MRVEVEFELIQEITHKGTIQVDVRDDAAEWQIGDAVDTEIAAVIRDGTWKQFVTESDEEDPDVMWVSETTEVLDDDDD